MINEMWIKSIYLSVSSVMGSIMIISTFKSKSERNQNSEHSQIQLDYSRFISNYVFVFQAHHAKTAVAVVQSGKITGVVTFNQVICTEDTINYDN